MWDPAIDKRLNKRVQTHKKSTGFIIPVFIEPTKVIEMSRIVLAVYVMHMMLCNQKLQRLAAGLAKPPAPRAQNPLRP